MEDLGKVFREFRISKNYSLKEAAGEACSTSQLSRFELGESDLAASRFFVGEGLSDRQIHAMLRRGLIIGLSAAQEVPALFTQGSEE